jgi:DNA repair exonuclease SbcCD ATPase subunit
MMKRFVLLSDLHAHPWSAFATGDGLDNSRLKRSLNILDASLQRAQEEDIPWVFAGDLVHTAGYSLNTVMTGIAQILAQCPEVPKLMVWGNHDARGIGGKINLEQTCLATLVYAGIKNLFILDPSVATYFESIQAIGVSPVECGGITFHGAGYQPNISLLELGIESDVGIYHQTVRGSHAPNGYRFDEGIDPDELRKRHHLSIVGHIHHPQQMGTNAHVIGDVSALELDNHSILIPGSPEHHNFGDRDEHGWWIVTLPSQNTKDTHKVEASPAIEFVPGGSPKFLTVDTPAGVVKDDGNFYRVRTVAVGEHVPDGVHIVSPSPTIVETRDTLRGVSEAEQVVRIWLDANTPPKGTREEHLKTGLELLVAQEPARLRDMRVTNLSLHNFCCFADQQIVLFGRTTKGLGADEVIRWGETECIVRATLKHEEEELFVTRRRGATGHTLSVTIGLIGTGESKSWEATSVTEMTAKLNRYLGITPEIFRNLAYFSQEELILFSSATDGERKNVLTDLIGLTAYQAAAVNATALAAAKQDTMKVQQARAITLQEQIEQQKETVQQNYARWQDWEKNHEQLLGVAEQYEEDLIEEHERLNEEEQERRTRVDGFAYTMIEDYRIAREAEREEREEEMRAELSTTNEAERAVVQAQLDLQIEKATKGFASLTDAHAAVAILPQTEEALASQQELIDRLNNSLAACNLELATNSARLEGMMKQISLAETELERAEKAFDAGICPTCKRPITKAHTNTCLFPLIDRVASHKEEYGLEKIEVRKSKDAKDEREKELEGANAHAAELRAEILRLQDVDRELKRVTVLQQELKQIYPVSDDVLTARVTEQIDHLVNLYIMKQRARVAQVALVTGARTAARVRQLAVAKTQQQELRDAMNPHKAAYAEALTQLRTIEGSHKTTEIAVIHAARMAAIYDYWRVGFSKQGLQSLLMEEIAKLFNDNRGNIFPLLTQGVYDVQFSTLSTTRKGELRERTDFYIYEHGKQVPYGTLSGGQRRRVDIGIMLVLTQAVATWMGTQGVLGLLILDEVFGFLDASGAEGLLAALGQINEQVPTIYVMTHDAALQSLIPNAIHVEQNAEGISEVV